MVIDLSCLHFSPCEIRKCPSPIEESDRSAKDRPLLTANAHCMKEMV